MKRTIPQSKLWVYLTASIMSFNGGYINAICLVSILGNSVGYVTGNITMAGESFDKGHYLACFHLLSLILFFLLGSIISGLIIKGQNLKRDHRYNTSLLIQATLVMLSTVLLLKHPGLTGFLLAMTMGMQNAMTTHYGSALIRTTHMTGTTTDLGILIGRWLKGHIIEYWKMLLYALLIIGFLIGAIAGAMSYSRFHAAALWLCVLIYLFMLIMKSTDARSPHS